MSDEIKKLSNTALGEEVARRIAEGGGKLILKGFGSFKTVQVKERTFRNLQTGQPVVSPAHDKITFKAVK